MKNIRYLYAVILFLFFISCRDTDKNGRLLDTPTTGSIKISADESLRPLIETEVETFNSIYTKAKVEVLYLPEIEAMEELMKDSVRLAIVTRHLVPEERAYFKEKRITPDEVDIALSGAAIIVNPERKDTLISMAQLKQILSGTVSNWNQLGSRTNAGIEIVFDNPKSGLVRYLKDSIAKVDKLPANCYAVENNEAVVDYVSKNPNALGLIGVEWISDDPTTNTFLKKVKVVGVSGDSTHFQPYQAYMALKHYPLMRTITVINRETRTGLGTGFSSFLASERGQRIILKTGLVPKTMPVRIIEVNPKPFEIEK
ncbi:PstS family phosphate ABC transporter substrate-binding protein [Chryseosolibacter indicus]|uniref:Substrate-binding domain-containing protein n=1 Tax=Chryseosolibacter indicus TaxID=2782351 RepID=A0ABS5VY58_9BACT|nr:substrate-binding domain-containing protein [Chryseosolibacter indicus]MBT1704941.1 substrate-binding domain-containing protein [Chryseosolibacter indicus]